jgi:glycosyltransferase involved in cell wall biosynthesis
MSESGATPRVSIGIPVFNGADGLARTLECLCGQTLRDFEIIISDNASTDATPAICRRFAGDPRVRYVRQHRAIPVTDNFNFVLRQARAPYFMWAAHDDDRDADFIETLVAALDHHPAAILAFGQVVEIVDGVPRRFDLDFANCGLSACARLRKAAYSPLHHLYGVWRTERLRTIPWYHNDWWHDTPPMMAATVLGDFVEVPGVVFRYRYNGHPFFDWPRPTGIRGALGVLGHLGRRGLSLVRLIWFSGATVAKVAGPRYGIAAGWFGCLKVLRQISGYVMRHHLRRPTADGLRAAGSAGP